MLTSYAYASISCQDCGEARVRQILQTAAERNSQLGVTSALYSDGETFFHVIEGEEAALAMLMASILRDPRHNSIEILDQFDLSGRMFNGSAIRHIDGSGDADLKDRFSYRNLTSLNGTYLEDRIRELACTSEPLERRTGTGPA